MNRSTLIAVLVCVALAVAVAVTIREKPERGITKVGFTGFDPESASSIVIEGAKPIEISRLEGAWFVGEKRADDSAVKRLLESVARIDSSELVTRNPDRFDALEVEGEKATRVAITAHGATVVDFVIGKASGGGSHVRVGDAVYVVPGVYRSTFSQDRAAWLDRTLFSDKQDDVQKVQVNLRGEPGYTLVREGKDWQLEDPSLMPAGHRFDRDAAHRLVSALVTARAADVLDEDPGAEVSGLTDGADTLLFDVAGEEGETVTRTIRLGADGENDAVYARVSMRDDLVTVPAHLARNLRKKLSDLRDLRLMSFDVGRAARVELVDGEKRLVFERSGDKWSIAESTEEPGDDFDLDAAMVRRRIGEVANIRALGEAETEAPKVTGLVDPAGRVSVHLEGGEVAVLEFGSATTWGDQEAVFARGNADDRVYLVQKRNRDRLLGGLDTFARRGPAAGGLGNLDPEALRNLPPEVRESLLRKLAEEQQRKRLIESLEAGREQEGQ